VADVMHKRCWCPCSRILWQVIIGYFGKFKFCVNTETSISDSYSAVQELYSLPITARSHHTKRLISSVYFIRRDQNHCEKTIVVHCGLVHLEIRISSDPWYSTGRRLQFYYLVDDIVCIFLYLIRSCDMR
jgi:hypothetical protein